MIKKKNRERECHESEALCFCRKLSLNKQTKKLKFLCAALRFRDKCELTLDGPRSALCLGQQFPEKESRRTTMMMMMMMTSSAADTAVCSWKTSHHLEDDSTLLLLTGPEHHTVIWSDKVHRLQNL